MVLIDGKFDFLKILIVFYSGTKEVPYAVGTLCRGTTVPTFTRQPFHAVKYFKSKEFTFETTQQPGQRHRIASLKHAFCEIVQNEE